MQTISAACYPQYHVLNLRYFTKQDISIQYYAFELDEESQKFYVIITPFGKKYKCLPMDLKCASDFDQQVIKQAICGFDNIEVY